MDYVGVMCAMLQSEKSLEFSLRCQSVTVTLKRYLLFYYECLTNWVKLLLSFTRHVCLITVVQRIVE